MEKTNWRLHPKGMGLISVGAGISMVRDFTEEEWKDHESGKARIPQYGETYCENCKEYDFFHNKNYKGVWKFTCSKCGYILPKW